MTKARRLDIVVLVMKAKKCVVIDIAVPRDVRAGRMEDENYNQ